MMETRALPGLSFETFRDCHNAPLSVSDGTRRLGMPIQSTNGDPLELKVPLDRNVMTPHFKWNRPIVSCLAWHHTESKTL